MGISPEAPVQGAVKLYLQFPCSNCRTPVDLSLKRLAQFRRAGGACPHCSTTLECPPLDRSAQGIEVVLNAAGFCAIECPACRGRLEARVDSLGKSRRCPGCGRRLTLKFVAEAAPTAAAPAAVGAESRSSRKRTKGDVGGFQSPSLRRPRPPPKRLHPQSRRCQHLNPSPRMI